jgi:hypothetical protein
LAGSRLSEVVQTGTRRGTSKKITVLPMSDCCTLLSKFCIDANWVLRVSKLLRESLKSGKEDSLAGPHSELVSGGWMDFSGKMASEGSGSATREHKSKNKDRLEDIIDWAWSPPSFARYRIALWLIT